MKFTHNHNTFYRKGAGYTPKKWIVGPEGKDHEATLKWWTEDKLWVWDCDICGDNKYLVAFEDGKAFKVYHDWYIPYEVTTGEEDFYVHNYFEIDEISLEEVPTWMHQERDWI